MSQPNPWQTAGRPRNSQSASRTPQNRSGTGSPNLSNPSQPPKREPNRSPQPPSNVWAQRSVSAGGSNGQVRVDSAKPEDNSFNAAEVKAFLAREASGAVYKPAEAPGGARNSVGAWGSKANTMANGQPFFVQLAKQIATMEGGG